MSSPLIAVTGIGGAAGYGLAQRLHKCGYEVLGLDADPWSPGFALAHRALTVPPAYDQGFLSEILDICRRENPAALISTVERELLIMAEFSGKFVDLATRIWLPDVSYLRLCLDKFEFYNVLYSHGINVPSTVLAETLLDDCQVLKLDDVVVKPRYGRGAKDTFYCRHSSEVFALAKTFPDLIVQPRIEGTEFTADCIIDTCGASSVVLRARHRTKAGLSVAGETIYIEHVSAAVNEVLDILGASGICNVQGFISNSDSTVYITDVNPRFSGGFPLSERAGARLVQEYLNGVFNRKVNHHNLRYRPGVIMRRYFTEVFE